MHLSNRTPCRALHEDYCIGCSQDMFCLVNTYIQLPLFTCLYLFSYWPDSENTNTNSLENLNICSNDSQKN